MIALLQAGYAEPHAARYDAATMGMFVLIIAIGVIGFIVQARLQSVFKKYSKVQFPGGLTGAEVAEKMLRDNNIHNVKVTHVGGHLTDHFNPQTMTVNLSDSVYSSSSVAAAAVAAHECGHAVQHAQGYFPIKLRSAIIPITNIGSQLAMPLFLIGFILSSYAEQYVWIAYAGVICYALCLLFQLVTLPTEFNASSRALAAIRETSLLDEEETQASKKVLSAAAMTYVAAVGVALMSLLRLLTILGRRRD